MLYTKQPYFLASPKVMFLFNNYQASQKSSAKYEKRKYTNMYRHRIREDQIKNKNYISLLENLERNGNYLKLFQVSVCSAVQLVLHGSEIHRMLYDFMRVWKLAI